MQSPRNFPPHNHPRRCDFCNSSTAILFCGPDNAKLCLSCDREVHSTNPLFTKHSRSLLCDNCDSSPATIFCSTDAVVRCHNCDWDYHNTNSNANSLNSLNSHDRRPIEGFTGCPSVNELLAILGFEDLGKRGIDDLVYGSDCFVWETPGFVSLDDLIVSSGSDHNGSDHKYNQAMGVPPLPKNRNAALGMYKEEVICQLRELAKLEPNGDDGQDGIKLISEFRPTKSFQLEGRSSGFGHKLEEVVNTSSETNTFQWCPDSCDEGGREFFSDQLVGDNTEASCIVPDGNLVNNQNSSSQPHHFVGENTPVFHGVGSTREINSQERETALTRYKAKKKSRRYDKHIRYESRKVRAESRARIRGRFAKTDR